MSAVLKVMQHNLGSGNWPTPGLGHNTALQATDHTKLKNWSTSTHHACSETEVRISQGLENSKGPPGRSWE